MLIYMSSKRQNCAKNADFDKNCKHSVMCYSWFIWQKCFKGELCIRKIIYDNQPETKIVETGSASPISRTTVKNYIKYLESKVQI